MTTLAGALFLGACRSMNKPFPFYRGAVRLLKANGFTNRIYD
jgi:hypothetical protein